ncbi:chemotaxis protein methyltransferase CheR [Natronospira proteinivora]|uniref:Chemotaxis protein methyltransferase n=1 Tax=Natronospira proteinivora TaxID=1807133 RepID=A0ABT1G7Y2_9GAMM|nr:CheR family methyltransferase [Natronospira proteinivora]MCP1726468.1 chemotaxis protein methyltransferase CheR [Natronospira proteinivora]
MQSYSFSDAEYDELRRLIENQVGIALSGGKRDLVYSRVSRRLRSRNLSSFAQYLSLLRSGDEEELSELVNAMTTNVTQFFRESHHFDYLNQKFFPEMVASKGSDKTIRIWSAGCSSGEEPYSIAIVLAEFLENHPGWKGEIWATDVDGAILRQAEDGIYAMDRLKSVSRERLRRFFLRGSGPNEGKARVGRTLRDLVSFQRVNLIESWPVRTAFDAIFCRNVIIYFDRGHKSQVVDGFADHLQPHGYLFLGHSESLHGLSERYQLIGQTIYRRR